MKYSLAALALAVTAVSADSLIPSGISSTCSTYLNKLNSDTTVQSCLKSLVDASSAFSPASTSTGEVKTTIKSMCDKSACTSSFRAELNAFSTACKTDFAKSADVLNLYDLLYVATPLAESICEVDSATQDYCVQRIAQESQSKVSAGTNTASIGNSTNLATVYTPVASTYKDTNLPFLFLNPSMDNKTFCGSCASAIMINYISFENANPYGYAPLNKSPILGGQSALYTAMTQKCPAAFIANIDTRSNPTVSANGALQRTGVPALATVVLGAMAVVFAA